MNINAFVRSEKLFNLLTHANMTFHFKKKITQPMYAYIIMLMLLNSYIFYNALNRLFLLNLTSNIVIVLALISIYPLNEYIRIRKLKHITPLVIDDDKINYYQFKKSILRKDIKEIRLRHGHLNSFACVILKAKEKIKWFEFKKKSRYKKYNTSFLINLEELKGDITDNFNYIALIKEPTN